MDDQIIRAMGDPKRFRLLQLMSQRGYCVSALAHASGQSESSVSQHLKILREAGLVFGVKRGYYTHYAVDKEVLSAVIEELQCMLTCKHKPCEGAFYGCPEAEYIQCRAYVPPEKRMKEEEKEC